MNPTVQTPAAPAVVPCPRCQQPLIDPAGLGWCKGCGYCRSLEEDRHTAALQPAAPTGPRGTFTETGAAITGLPTAVWVTFGVALTIAGASIAVDKFLELTPFHRALWSTLQIAAGLAVMFVGQLIGLIRIAPEDSTLTIKDAILPFRLYGMAPKFLPKTRLTLMMGAWGVALIASAILLIGGLGHWMNYLPGRDNAQKGYPAARR